MLLGSNNRKDAQEGESKALTVFEERGYYEIDGQEDVQDEGIDFSMGSPESTKLLLLSLTSCLQTALRNMYENSTKKPIKRLELLDLYCRVV